MEKERTLSIISTIGMFLLLEVLAFISFGLSNSYVVYAIIGIVVMIIMIAAHFSLLKKEGFSSIVIFIIPLLLFGFITALNSFNSAVNTSLLIKILIPLGFLAFSALGYLSSFSKTFKISTALMVIYGGLALFVLISLVATMIQFVPFYTIIYKNYYIYYNGARTSASIGSMAYSLNGFSFHEVSLEYFSLFPSAIPSALPCFKPCFMPFSNPCSMPCFTPCFRAYSFSAMRSSSVLIIDVTLNCLSTFMLANSLASNSRGNSRSSNSLGHSVSRFMYLSA